MTKSEERRIEEQVKPEPVELMSQIVEDGQEFDLDVFRETVVKLFDDALQVKFNINDDGIRGRLARLRARIQIELKQ